MPELPEVETVRCGLVPAMAGATIVSALTHRPDLRFPFPGRFAERLTGARVERLHRRGKYLLADLDTGEVWITHLGMSGRMMVQGGETPARFVREVAADKHLHVEVRVEGGAEGPAHITYADPRRFGFMDLVAKEALETCRHFQHMGPEPLSSGFSASVLRAALDGKKAPIKNALLDQAVVAGLGNIYVCEALFRAGVSPRRAARGIGLPRVGRIVQEVQDVLSEAIEAGGSSLRDYAAADGTMGRFQFGFQVYGREGEPCGECGSEIQRIVQSGRSTFFCGRCQR